MSSSVSQSRITWRSIGLWMAAVLVAYTLFNVIRATLNPAAFAFNFGIPQPEIQQNAFVYVYAIRSLFIGLYGLTLLIRRDGRGLALYALVGAVMPMGDAALVAARGGPAGTVLRHGLTAVFLLVTCYFLQRSARQADARAV